MSYCTPSDVSALNKARVIGVGNNPTLADVQTYVDMVAGEIDATLLTRGIQVPVDASSYPEAAALLRSVNAKGAWAMMEDASASSVNLDRAKAAYDNALKLLADAKFTPDSPADIQRGEVRAPWLTFTPPDGVYDPTLRVIGGETGDGISAGPPNRRQLPYFSRSLRW